MKGMQRNFFFFKLFQTWLRQNRLTWYYLIIPTKKKKKIFCSTWCFVIRSNNIANLSKACFACKQNTCIIFSLYECNTDHCAVRLVEAKGSFLVFGDRSTRGVQARSVFLKGPNLYLRKIQTKLWTIKPMSTT